VVFAGHYYYSVIIVVHKKSICSNSLSRARYYNIILCFQVNRTQLFDSTVVGCIRTFLCFLCDNGGRRLKLLVLEHAVYIICTTEHIIITRVSEVSERVRDLYGRYFKTSIAASIKPYYASDRRSA